MKVGTKIVYFFDLCKKISPFKVPEMTKRVKKFVKDNGKVRSDGTIGVAKRESVWALRHVFR